MKKKRENIPRAHLPSRRVMLGGEVVAAGVIVDCAEGGAVHEVRDVPHVVQVVVPELAQVDVVRHVVGDGELAKVGEPGLAVTVGHPDAQLVRLAAGQTE